MLVDGSKKISDYFQTLARIITNLNKDNGVLGNILLKDKFQCLFLSTVNCIFYD